MYRPAPLVRTHVSGVAPGTGVGRGVRARLGAGADKKSCGCASRGGGALALAELGQDGAALLARHGHAGPRELGAGGVLLRPRQAGLGCTHRTSSRRRGRTYFVAQNCCELADCSCSIFARCISNVKLNVCPPSSMARSVGPSLLSTAKHVFPKSSLSCV